MINFRHYIITPGLNDPVKLINILFPLLKAGLPCLQIREPEITADHLLVLLEHLNNCCINNNLSCKFVVNHYHNFVRDYNREFEGKYPALGLHLKEESISPEEAREMLGQEALIGISTHKYTEKEKNDDPYLSYRSVSPIFSTISKDLNKAPVGVGLIKQISEQSIVPIFALGGITAENANLCIQNGAYGVATLGAVFGSRKPVESYRHFAERASFGALQHLH
ncbi:MAG: thiamine phosphate synthase [Deltaproteobacteria bacterium]|nr:thiamine phosphate synthase [Deltaproteobacteria bacterium]